MAIKIPAGDGNPFSLESEKIPGNLGELTSDGRVRSGRGRRCFTFTSFIRTSFGASQAVERRIHVRCDKGFAMIKAKFGDHIRSRPDTAMKTEALCKIPVPQHLLCDPKHSRVRHPADFSRPSERRFRHDHENFSCREN